MRVQILIVFITYIVYIGSANNYCPVINCDGEFYEPSSFTCYQHNQGTVSNMQMNVKDCGYGQRCKMDNVFQISNPINSKPNYSQSKLYAWCTFDEGFWKDLYPGSHCLFDYQCLSKNCTWKCHGREENQHCMNDWECEVGYFCKPITTNALAEVRYNVCSKLLQENEVCESGNSIFECQPGYKCLKQKTSDQRRCMKIHQLSTGLDTVDAELCESSIQRNGKCVDITGMRNDGQSLSNPYKCDLSKDRNCQAIYSDGSFATFQPCQCSYSGSQDAYCPFPGSTDYKKLFTLYRDISLASPNCHIDIIKNKDFIQWEVCTSDKSLLKEFKNQQRLVSEWAIQRNTDTFECYKHISSLTDPDYPIYIQVEQIAQQQSQGLLTIFQATSLLISFLVLIQ